VIYKPVTFDKLRAAIASQFEEQAPARADAAASPQRTAPHLRPVPVEYLDPTAIETLRDVRDTPEFLCRMISEGVLDIERIDGALASALLRNDLGAVHREAHALRGVCLSIGAVRLGSLADRQMSISHRALEESARERHPELRKTLDLSRAALDAQRQAIAADEAARAG
jgi:two-component system sensor histidine kinase RpfC